MQLTVNGKPAEVAMQEATVAVLLDELKVKQALYVTVELNGKILDRNTHGAATVKDGDNIEFLYFMGGGSRHAE